jgi:hypothetical protein
MEKPQKPWPDRYEITFTSPLGASFSYSVCTWFSEEKAIAIAASHHNKSSGAPIYSVSVKSLGPAAKLASGVVNLSNTDLHDRMEW